MGLDHIVISNDLKAENVKRITTGNKTKLLIKKSTIKFCGFKFEVKIFVKIKIINISKKTIKFDRNTEKIILLFFFEVFVILETLRISVMSNFNLFIVFNYIIKLV